MIFCHWLPRLTIVFIILTARCSMLYLAIVLQVLFITFDSIVHIYLNLILILTKLTQKVMPLSCEFIKYGFFILQSVAVSYDIARYVRECKTLKPQCLCSILMNVQSQVNEYSNHHTCISLLTLKYFGVSLLNVRSHIVAF